MKRLALVALLVFGFSAGTSQARSGVCSEVLGFEGCSVAPHEMGYGAHASIYGVKWRNWGSDNAIGVGHLLWHRTVSEPSFGPYVAKLRFAEPIKCGGNNWYAVRTLKIRRAGRWEVLERDEPFGPCQ